MHIFHLNLILMKDGLHMYEVFEAKRVYIETP